MNEVMKAKIMFVSKMLLVKHSKHGARKITNMLAMKHLNKLSLDPDKDCVLHVGCGTGDETRMIAERAKTVIGVSPDPEVLQIARRETDADNVEYVAEEMKGASPRLDEWRVLFDKVVTFSRVTLFPDVPAALSHMCASLKPGGEMLCVIGNNDYGFFEGATKIIEEHPEWGQRVKSKVCNVTMWQKDEAQTPAFFNAIGKWKQLTCEFEINELSITEGFAKHIWLDCLDHVEVVGDSGQTECLEALWQWAVKKYGRNEDGFLKKPSEFIVIHGVKADA